jgi:nucleotide-binding universal stress UspA family protein
MEVMRMADSVSQKSAYLALDELAANPRLARRLSPDLAWRFHALPLAEDNGRITVAMADPDDRIARDAVIRALGPTSCMVRADATIIDMLLAQIWSDDADDCLNLLVCDFPEPVSEEVSGYAQSMGESMSARVTLVTTAGTYDALTATLESMGRNLVLLGESEHPLIHRLLSRQTTAPHALLVARKPRWPLRSILLVIWGDETDEAAVDWVVRLARPNGSAVTALAIVPPLPAMYGCQGRMAQGLPALLSSDTPLGRRMKQVACRLVDWEIEGTLRLRQGPQEWQLRREVIEGNHDLIAVAARPRQWWQRWLEGDLVGHLLHQADRPVLVAKPTTA